MKYILYPVINDNYNNVQILNLALFSVILHAMYAAIRAIEDGRHAILRKKYFRCDNSSPASECTRKALR